MADSLRNKASAKYNEARDKVGDAYAKSRASVETAAASSKAKALEAAEVTRANAKKAADATLANARKAADKTAKGIEHNPIVALAGGLAIGVIAAALLPRTAREDKLAGNVGKTVRKTASNAAKAATATAKEQLDSLGVNADAARAQFRDIATKVGKAAVSAGGAAADSVRKK